MPDWIDVTLDSPIFQDGSVGATSWLSPINVLRTSQTVTDTELGMFFSGRTLEERY